MSITSEGDLKRFDLRVKFNIDPKGKASHRSCIRNSRIRTYKTQGAIVKQIKNVMIYKVKNLDDRIITFMHNADHIKVSFSFGFPIRKSVSKVKRRLMLDGTIKPTIKPDVDNIMKLFLDCGNQILYKDDKFIVGGTFEKSYAEEGSVFMNLSYFKGKND